MDAQILKRDIRIKFIKVVDVSIQDCDEAVSDIVSSILEAPKDETHLILHFGVAAGRKCFSLENRAKNILDFRCPDERGNTP